MEDRLIQKLKELKSIKPEEGFIQRSRNLILSAPQKFGFRFTFFENLKLASAISLASALIFVIFGGLSLLNVKNLSPVLLTGANEDNLKAEVESLDIQIQLGEVAYDLGDEKEIGAKLDDLINGTSL